MDELRDAVRRYADEYKAWLAAGADDAELVGVLARLNAAAEQLADAEDEAN